MTDEYWKQQVFLGILRQKQFQEIRKLHELSEPIIYTLIIGPYRVQERTTLADFLKQTSPEVHTLNDSFDRMHKKGNALDVYYKPPKIYLFMHQ